ncbi:hypothetical protein GCM10010168_77630 [Actinoplanes ianthinogenes]|uniref:DUF3040 domain-containing protein n=1 Tax=Actinoplanes ianthinogenes TaxID=122358 RepID=A0ABN6CSS1_9ACTN|nr:hypothetical protein [Actinoplanes ianthinogenes]BCJ48311.1 hypothetical protein Aiant_89680 [Actinoplanes ianthinogenes]GGR47232.1 hypothetical protein GCM10010168_77630 [Actinoplanes ianthinogenes]
MESDRDQREFDRIVARLVDDFPGLAGRRRWPRQVRIAVAVFGGLLWGLLSVAMVAWGAAGVVLTCVLVAAAVALLIADHYRRGG